MVKTVVEGRGDMYAAAMLLLVTLFWCTGAAAIYQCQKRFSRHTESPFLVFTDFVWMLSDFIPACIYSRDQRGAKTYTWKNNNKRSKGFCFRRWFFFFVSYRIEDVGVRRLHVARGLFCVSRLWEAYRYRILHPRQKQLLLRALLRGQVCSSVQPLQKGAKIIFSLKLSFRKCQNTPKYITTQNDSFFLSS